MFFKEIVLFYMFVSTSLASNVAKRGIFDTWNSFESSNSASGPYFQGYNGGTSYPAQAPLLIQKVYGSGPPTVSPAEIAAAIQAAKEASTSVMAAQQRVQEAKEAVLHQQALASQKQADAALALQKTEAAAAIQQQEAKAAANSLVQSQQRLAQAKAEVSEQQRIAAIKEAQAAATIQKSANAAAHEIQRTDDAARKLSAIQYSGSAAIRQAARAKEGTLTATSAAVAAAASAEQHSSNDDGGASSAWYGQKVVQLHPWG